MDVQQREDAAAFVAETSDLLLRAPARHNLMLGICDLLLRRPEVYPTFHLWTVLGAGRVVGAALRMPPHNLVVAAPLEEGAIPAIAGEIRRSGAALPGVVGAVPETAAFAQAWTTSTGGAARPSTRQGVYELREIRGRGDARGAPRLATGADLELLARWHEDFVAEAVPDHIGDASMRRRRLEGAIHDGEYWLWEDEGRGPVYMPP
jgi:uncharacterized protein